MSTTDTPSGRHDLYISQGPAESVGLPDMPPRPIQGCPDCGQPYTFFLSIEYDIDGERRRASGRQCYTGDTQLVVRIPEGAEVKAVRFYDWYMPQSRITLDFERTEEDRSRVHELPETVRTPDDYDGGEIGGGNTGDPPRDRGMLRIPSQPRGNQASAYLA